MSKVETLNELSQLEQSRFGRPSPRHGLKLLYWFANECVSFDPWKVLCDPEYGDFGFHPFDNRYDRNRVKLLPEVNFPYYVVGNLNYHRAYELPDYVSEDYTHCQDNSNMDRIIVSIIDDEWIDKVYVTEHDGRKHYSSQATYRISKGLLKIISNLELKSFLMQTGFLQPEISYQLLAIAYDRNSISRPTRVASVPARVERPRNQDIRIEVESLPKDDFMYTRRSRCCECTIL